MREVLAMLDGWSRQGVPFGLATVVASTAGSVTAPGDLLAVDPAGEVCGGIPAGCVESAVLDAATETLRTGRTRLARYPVGGDGPWPARPGCAGVLEVLHRRVTPDGPARRVLAALTGPGPVAAATVVGGPAPFGAQCVLRADRTEGTLGDSKLDDWVAGQAAGLWPGGGAVVRHRAGRPPVRVLVQAVPVAPQMVLFGATAVAAALSRIAAGLGYRVIVCDPRPAFTTPRRFPDAHEVHRAWPHRWLAGTPVDPATVLCLLGHDPRYEIPLLHAALATPAGYVGVLGSRSAHAARLARLRADGVPPAQLTRLIAPAGLDLGGRNAAETALAIAAEVVARRHDGTGRALHGLAGPIHRVPARDRQPAASLP
ncbi:XdhC family protein [Micromonospora sp. DR5-3]|uniref:XdhC family protein n=1 Tax=unclassified Micromonospora TaxID=2617518 RepID=UPI0011DA65E1|nr:MULTISPECIES: XdhC/CoxI family protein [unclassified Micromonospora]MCW3819441.1 XdhC family protein [Micromonospora sp. DR5-3]TYC20774.1 XdhC family protein [Micromonospora sp. MP36]